MKQIIALLILIVPISMYSQAVQKSIEPANYISSKPAYFYKDSWKPFSGNIKTSITYKKHLYLAKIKFENGFANTSELIDPESNKLAYCLDIRKVHGFEKEVFDSIHLKSRFDSQAVFTDTITLRKQYVTTYFHRIKEQNVKLNGFVKSQQKITYFENGMIVKIEYYYDSDCKKIAESYLVFHTVIGNIDKCDKNVTTFDGNYFKWNSDGKIIESGSYVLGEKRTNYILNK